MSGGRALAVALVLVLPALLAGLGRLPLIDPDEGRYAWAARVMARDGLALTPEFNGEPRFAKPAPITWAQALSMRLLGESELAVRLPGALCALAAVALIFRVAADLAGPVAGLTAALVLGTGFRFVMTARQALVDAPLALALSAAMAEMVALVRGPAVARARHLARAHLWMGLGFLLKGPIALLLPWGALGLYRLVRRRPVLDSARPGRALLLAAAVALPYFIAMGAVHGTSYLREVTVRQQWQRFRGVSFGQPTARGPGYFLKVIPADLMPWTPAVAVALGLLWRARREPEGDATATTPAPPGRREALLFLLLWALSVTVVFSASRFKLPHYVLPAYPALAVVTGVALAAAPRRRLLLAATLPGLLAVAAVLLAGAQYLHVLLHGGLTTLMRNQAGTAGAATAWQSPLPLALAACAALMAMLLLLIGGGRTWRHAVLALGVVAALAYAVLGAVVVPRLAARFRPEPQLAAAVPPDAPVALYGMWSSAFIYYLGRRVEFLATAPELEQFLAGHDRATVLVASPVPPELARRSARIIAGGEVLTPRLTDLWRPRPVRTLLLLEVRP